MKVETFECSETAAEPIEAAEEAIEIIRNLGLNGQLELLAPNDETKRAPYREMTADEVFVYETICPTKAKLEDYRRTPIPLRVLQIASHVTDLGLCESLEVWDAASPAEKDPVLVGVSGSRHSSNFKRFILARWGEELETFVVLFKRAVAVKREQIEQKYREISSDCAAKAGQVGSLSDAEIVKKSVPSFYH